jgi:glycosyltransferase involved in cell wall biosynthesis
MSAESIALVLKGIPSGIGQVIVVDNGSTDQTAAVAAKNGATVVHEPQRGYGQACLRGISTAGDCDILDADFCGDPELIPLLIEPIESGHADFVLGSRYADSVSKQCWGNSLACMLMKFIWRVQYTDLGPFRAISRNALTSLNMQDQNFGWTVEMQIRALKRNLRIVELSTPYRQRRYGKSKISQTVSGVIGAGSKILFVIAREFIKRDHQDKKSHRGTD